MPSDRLILGLREGRDGRRLGGKAQALADLLRAGFPVPPACVVTTDALDRHIADAGLAPLCEAVARAAAGQTAVPQPYDAVFTSAAMRVDYFHTGGLGTEIVALDRVVERTGPGQAASGSLARLSQVLEPGEHVDPAEAVLQTLRYHPEKAWVVWSAWREDVPLEPSWAIHLLRSSEGLNKRLLRYWAQNDPVTLAVIIEEWEPEGPHSRRFEVAQTYLGHFESEDLRSALDLPSQTE